MANTTFVNNSTLIVDTWMNDVNGVTYSIGTSVTGMPLVANALGSLATYQVLGVVGGGTGSATAAGARTNLGAAEVGANTSITSLASPAIAGATATTQSPGDSTTKVATTAFVAAAVAAGNPVVPVRQTVLSGPVDTDGFAAFVGATGSTTVTATGTLIATASNGFGASGNVDRVGSITNPSWTGLSTNGAMYLYLDIASNGTCTTGSTTLAPTYRDGGADVVTNNQFTFNKQVMIGKVGNGSVATQTYRVFVGEVTVAGAVVTAIVWYQLMGRYKSADTTIPGLGASVAFNHNIGVLDVEHQLFSRCITNSGNFLVGYVNSYLATQSGTAYGPLQPMQQSTKQTTYTMGSSSALILVDPSTGGLNSQTTANFKFFLVAKRGW